MTRKEVIENVLNMEEVKANAEMVEALEKILAQVSKKRTSKTPAQKANDEMVEKIYDIIVKANGPVVIATIMAEFEISNQKATALVKKLVDAGKVQREKDGKKTVYVLAD